MSVDVKGCVCRGRRKGEIMNFERNLPGLYRQTYICLKKEVCKALIDP